MAENDSKRVKGSVLVVAGAVLILVTVIILLSLRRPLDERIEREATASPAPSAAAPPRTAVPSAPTSRPSSAPGVKPAPTPEVKTSAHVQAPPAISSELAKETDPVKRAHLAKLHKLTTARVRLSLLRRRERMLTESIARARKDGSWSAGKLQEAERDLSEIGGAIQAAARRLDEVRVEVGGDIDK